MQIHIATLNSCISPSRAPEQPYLHAVVEELPNRREAAVALLQSGQPGPGVLDVLWVHVDVISGSAKRLHHKRSEPGDDRRAVREGPDDDPRYAAAGPTGSISSTQKHLLTEAVGTLQCVSNTAAHSTDVLQG